MSRDIPSIYVATCYPFHWCPCHVVSLLFVLPHVIISTVLSVQFQNCFHLRRPLLNIICFNQRQRFTSLFSTPRERGSGRIKYYFFVIIFNYLWWVIPFCRTSLSNWVYLLKNLLIASFCSTPLSLSLSHGHLLLQNHIIKFQVFNFCDLFGMTCSVSYVSKIKFLSINLFYCNERGFPKLRIRQKLKGTDKRASQNPFPKIEYLKI